MSIFKRPVAGDEFFEKIRETMFPNDHHARVHIQHSATLGHFHPAVRAGLGLEVDHATTVGEAANMLADRELGL